VDKVVKAELEPIIEEEKKQSMAQTPAAGGEVNGEGPAASDGRLAWQYEKSDTKARPY